MEDVGIPEDSNKENSIVYWLHVNIKCVGKAKEWKTSPGQTRPVSLDLYQYYLGHGFGSSLKDGEQGGNPVMSMF